MALKKITYKIYKFKLGLSPSKDKLKLVDNLLFQKH